MKESLEYQMAKYAPLEFTPTQYGAEYCNKYLKISITCYGYWSNLPHYGSNTEYFVAPHYTPLYNWLDKKGFPTGTEESFKTLLKEYIEETIDLSVPNPAWVGVEDLELLGHRLKEEFGANIFIFGNKHIAIYKGQVWDIATGGNNKEHLSGWYVSQGHYDYQYFPKMSENLGHRIAYLSLRESLPLSRQTVKTYLYGKPREISNSQFAKWFEKWLGQSSWKSSYWKHTDKFIDGERWSVIGNHAKNMLIVTDEEGMIHVYSGKEYFVVKKLSWLFYKFAKSSLVNGKDYSVTGVGWSMTW
jgi:hypothetical protein